MEKLLVRSEFEKHGLARTGKVDVEAIDVRTVGFTRRDQRRAPLFGHEGQYGILGVLGCVAEIDARREALQDPRPDHAERDMRRLERVAGAWNASRLHRAKTEAAVLVRSAAAEAQEIRIDGEIAALIFGMRVATRCAGLPDLDQRIHHR